MQQNLRELPRNTLTEFLRALDPFSVSRDAEPTDGAYISKGMWTMLHMEGIMDEYGVRKFYVRLLETMRTLLQNLEEAGGQIKSEEYVYLLRCAGAASDITMTRWVWNKIKRTGELDYWERRDIYYEYIRARFLTEPLYKQYNKALFAVQPRDLHGMKFFLGSNNKTRLEGLRIRLAKRQNFFGMNKDIDYAEPLRRQLRKLRPVFKLFHAIREHAQWGLDEKTICALMVAMAHNGSLRTIASRMLWDFFGVRVPRLNLENFKVSEEAADLYNMLPIGDIRIRPTVLLLRTVVEVYGTNSEIAIAAQLVHEISQKFQLPVPLSVWQALLEYAVIASSPPFRTAWWYAGMSSFKVPPNLTIEAIWAVMCSPPHNIRPGFDQYAILIRNLIARRKFLRAIKYMRKARPFYTDQCHEFEAACFEYIQAKRDGLHGRAMSEIFHRYERARFLKQYMYYNLRAWSRDILKSWIPAMNVMLEDWISGKPDGVVDIRSRVAYRIIPNFIQEFRGRMDEPNHFGDGFSDEVLPNPLRYQTPTGYVDMRDPARETPRIVESAIRKLDVAFPIPRQRFYALAREDRAISQAWLGGAFARRIRVNQKRVRVLSRHSLAPLISNKLDPLRLLTGSLKSFKVRWQISAGPTTMERRAREHQRILESLRLMAGEEKWDEERQARRMVQQREERPLSIFDQLEEKLRNELEADQEADPEADMDLYQDPRRHSEMRERRQRKLLELMEQRVREEHWEELDDLRQLRPQEKLAEGEILRLQEQHIKKYYEQVEKLREPLQDDEDKRREHLDYLQELRERREKELAEQKQQQELAEQNGDLDTLQEQPGQEQDLQRPQEQHMEAYHEQPEELQAPVHDEWQKRLDHFDYLQKLRERREKDLAEQKRRQELAEQNGDLDSLQERPGQEQDLQQPQQQPQEKEQEEEKEQEQEWGKKQKQDKYDPYDDKYYY